MTPNDTQAIAHAPNLTLAAAQKATEACMRRASSLVPMNIAVVDSTLHLLSFARMPGAKLTSIDIAINKAFTAAGHRIPTANYKEAVWPGGAAYGINLSNGGRFMVIGGGVPIALDDETVVGAVGCSTGTPDQDRIVAEAGVDAVKGMLGREGWKVKARL